MIDLSFEHLDETTCKIAVDRKEWLRNLYYDAFYGAQYFIVNGSIFYGDYPILGFARELMRVVYELKHGSQTTYLSSPDSTSPTLRFSAHEDTVFIKESGYQLDDSPEQVLLEELYIAASEYLNYVVEQFKNFVPELETAPEIQKWLTDVSIRGDFFERFY